MKASHRGVTGTDGLGRAMTDVAVVGVGAIGGVVAARLASAGRNVVLCVREPFDELVVEGPDGTVTVTPPVVTSPEAVGSVPWVLLATKAHQTSGASGWLRALATPQTTIVILQNGVEHEARVRPFAHAATLVAAVVECRAARIAPGRIAQHTAAEIVVPATDAGRNFLALCEGTPLGVRVTADFVTAAWRKLCLNVAGGAITALSDRTLGVLRRPDVADVARGLIRECIEVGRAEGAVLEEELADEIVGAMVRGPEDASTSMLADRRAGQPLEVDARNGAVVRIGARHGIKTPLNGALTALLAAMHAGP
jgi:2-dehydropantoate 2-reductase